MTYTATEIQLRIAEHETTTRMLRRAFLDDMQLLAEWLMRVTIIRCSWVTYNPQLLLTYEP